MKTGIKRTLAERYEHERRYKPESKTKYLERMYVSERLKKINDVIPLNEHVTLLVENIDMSAIKAYIGFFNEIKKFVDSSNVPEFKRATEEAYDDLMTLMGGGSGIFQALRSEEPREFVAGMMKRLQKGTDRETFDDISHFLWGITALAATIPDIFEALDVEMEGALKNQFTEGVLREKLGDGIKSLFRGSNREVKPEDYEGWSMSNDETKIDPEDYKDVTLADYIIKHFDERNDRAKGTKLLQRASNLLLAKFKQEVAGFTGQVPYLNSKSAVEQLLKLKPNELKGMIKSADQLHKKWQAGLQQMKAAQAATKQISNASQNIKTTSGKEGSRTSATSGGDKSVKIDIGGGEDMDITMDGITKMVKSLTSSLKTIGKKFSSGSKPDESTLLKLRKLKSAIDDLNT